MQHFQLEACNLGELFISLLQFYGAEMDNLARYVLKPHKSAEIQTSYQVLVPQGLPGNLRYFLYKGATRTWRCSNL